MVNSRRVFMEDNIQKQLNETFFRLHAFDFLEPIFDLKPFGPVHDHGGIKGSNTYLDYFIFKIILEEKNRILYA